MARVAQRRRVDYPEVEAAVRAVLNHASPERPVRRRVLIYLVRRRLRALYPEWKNATWQRVVCRALQVLQRNVPPVVNVQVSGRRGYYFAHTEEDLRDGYRYKRRLAFTILSDTARAMGRTLPGMAVELELEFGDAP